MALTDEERRRTEDGRAGPSRPIATPEWPHQDGSGLRPVITERGHEPAPPTTRAESAGAAATGQAARPATYWAASSHYGPATHEARERYEELDARDLLARSYATLKARGEFDPQRHGEGNTEPLTPAEHLERLAAGELLVRSYRHPGLVHQALDAGATWQQVAGAMGCDEDKARQDYRAWAEGQHGLWKDYEGRFGMDDAEYAATLSRAAEPEREAG